MSVAMIRAESNVMLKIPNGEVKTATLTPGSTVSLGRYGSFFADQLIGKRYGTRFEAQNKLLTELPPLTVEDIEETDATNELINDDKVPPLSSEEIEALKSSGVHVSEIIQKQIEQHATFKLKNEYSKDKYKKRKEAKFSKNFTVIEPTLFNVSEYWFRKDQNRIRDLRADTLTQLLHFGNVQPGGRYLAVDDVSGLLVSAILDRLNGNGRLLSIGDVDGAPAYPVMTQMNFSAEMLDVHAYLNWATGDESYTPILLQTEPMSEGVNERHQARLNKRKNAADALTKLRNELFAGEFDGLLIASQLDPLSVLEKLEPYLAGSSSIVVYSSSVQVVAELQSALRDKPQYLGPTVSEAWLRQYQVLPGRAHPTMTTSGSGGFLLHTLKVFDDPTASSAHAHRKKVKTQTDETLVSASIASLIQPAAEADVQMDVENAS